MDGPLVEKAKQPPVVLPPQKLHIFNHKRDGNRACISVALLRWIQIHVDFLKEKYTIIYNVDFLKLKYTIIYNTYYIVLAYFECEKIQK